MRPDGVPRALRRMISLDEIEQAVMAAYNVPSRTLRVRRRRSNGARQAAIYLSRQLTGRTLAEIGSHFGRIKAQAASNVERQMREHLSYDRRLAGRINKIAEQVA